MSKTVLFLGIQFSISTQFTSIWRIDRTVLSAVTPGQSRSRIDSNEGVFHILQSSSITGDLLTNCLASYLEHSKGESNPSSEIQSVYSAAPANWAKKK